MDWLQFWEWGIWPWLGDLIASQTFLALMVPVATLTGVVITTKSNERIRRRELQGAGEQWRYEVVKESAANQRQAVLSAIRQISDLIEQVEPKNKGYAHQFSGPVGTGYAVPVDVLSRLAALHWLMGEVYVVVLTLELEIACPEVMETVEYLREAVIKEVDQILVLKTGQDSRGATTYLIKNYPQPDFVDSGIMKLKDAAIKYLHPHPPEMPTQPPPQRWWLRRHLDSLSTVEKEN